MKKVLVTDSLFIYPEHEKAMLEEGIQIERIDKPNASESELITAINDKDGYILGGIEKVTEPVVLAANNLKVISFTGTAWKGFIPSWELATKRGIKITNAPHANASAVAEWSFATSLAMVRDLFDLGKTGDGSFKTTAGFADLSVGIIGMGHVGFRIAELFNGIGVNQISYWNRSEINSEYDRKDISDVLKSSDLVFVCVSGEAGPDFLNEEKLSRLKQGAIITSLTESIVDEQALLVALQKEKIRAFLDWTPKLDGFKQLPLSSFYCSNESTAFNTKAANKLASDIVTQSIINVLTDKDDSNIVNQELFDIVNRQDEVIGVTNKVKAHKNGELHRVGAVYVFDDQGKLYVQVHKKSGGLYDHSVGGHISKGESYAEGTAREAQEELGITQSLKELAVFYSDEGPDMQHMFGLYTCVAEPSWKFIPNDEVDEIIPMALEDIQDLMKQEPKRFTRGFINTMNEYIRLKSK